MPISVLSPIARSDTETKVGRSGAALSWEDFKTKMISIRRFLELSSQDGGDSTEESLRLRELLHRILERRNRKTDSKLDLRLNSQGLLSRLEGAGLLPEVLAIANEALELSENEIVSANEFFDEHSCQMQSMVAMLTGTVADIYVQSDESVAQLQGIERKIERALGLDDVRALRDSLASCLTAVKEAAIQQRKATQSTVERLRNHIKRLPQVPAENNGAGTNEGAAEYVATFRLQRASHILERFGAEAQDQMLATISEGLKLILGPNDRLMRWKGPSFVMLLSSSEGLLGLRRRLSVTVTKICQNYVELGERSTLLAVGLDWVVFPQDRFPSSDVMFVEVDSFLERSAERQ
jgi:GGDEF domain-containing protein